MSVSSLVTLDWFPILPWPFTCLDVCQDDADGMYMCRVMREHDREIRWIAYEILQCYASGSGAAKFALTDVSDVFFDARPSYVPSNWQEWRKE